MKANKILSFLTNPLALSTLLYIILGLFLLPFYQYWINTDSTSYVSIAQKYFSGDWSQAVNGYWSPMYSWLLAIFLSFDLPTLLTVKIVSLIIGCFTLGGAWLLSRRFFIDEKIKIIILFSLVPVILYFSLQPSVPDLLATCILIYYFYFTFDPHYRLKMSNGIFSGTLGAVGYLAKTYIFPFFLIHFFVVNIIHFFYVKQKIGRKKVIYNFFLGALLFLAISGMWVFLISSKYKIITFGTNASYNHAIVSPPKGYDPYIIFRERLLTPPNETAISFWEDPSYIRISDWSPFESLNNFTYQFMSIFRNFIYLLDYITQFSIFSLIIFIIYAVILMQRILKKGHFSLFILTLHLTVLLLYPLGYLATVMEPRYFWPLNIIFILMGGHLVTILAQENRLKPFFKKHFWFIPIIGGMLALSFIIFPIESLIVNINNGKPVYIASKILKKAGGGNSKIASAGEWYDRHLAMHMAFHIDGKYYGSTNYLDRDKILSELKEKRIDYYLIYYDSKTSTAEDYIPLALRPYALEIDIKNSLKNVKIYNISKLHAN